MARDFKYFGDDFKKLSLRSKFLISAKLPEIVAVEGVNFFKSSFDNQGFKDQVLVKWKDRKAPKYKSKKRKRSSLILYSSASDRKGTHLKDSIRARTGAGRIIFLTDKIYAQVHNEGGRAGRGRGFTMPKRQFMGQSRALDIRIRHKLYKEIDKMLNK